MKIIELILAIPLLAQVVTIPPEDSRINPRIWIAKTDSLGELQWAKAYNGELPWTYGSEKDIAQLTSDGGIVITGANFHRDLTRNLILLKLDSKGDSVWSRTFDREDGGIEQYLEKYRKKDSIQGERSHNLFGRAVVETPDKGYMIVGELCCDSTVSWRNPGPPHYYEGFLLIKTDSLGEEQWRRRFDIGEEELDFKIRHSLYSQPNNEYTITIYDGGEPESSLVICVDSTGNTLWEHTGKDVY